MIDRNKLYTLVVYIPSTQSITKESIIVFGECLGERIRSTIGLDDREEYEIYFDKIYFMTNGKEFIINQAFNHQFETTKDGKYWKSTAKNGISNADRTAQMYITVDDLQISDSKIKKIIKSMFKNLKV